MRHDAPGAAAHGRTPLKTQGYLSGQRVALGMAVITILRTVCLAHYRKEMPSAGVDSLVGIGARPAQRQKQ
jgi:hypothetical protein